jgi:hypothetical protein
MAKKSAKEKLAEVASSERVNDASGDAAAATLATTSTPGDPPSEADVDLDFDFLSFDPADPRPHLLRAGMAEEEVDTLLADFVCRWVNTDHRRYDKQVWRGWQPVTTDAGPVRRGDLILCRMSRARANAYSRQLAQRKALRRNAAMDRFEQEVKPLTESGNFETFDDPSGPRLRK